MNRRRSASGVGILQPAPDDEERDETEVGFGLAAAGGKPDEVEHIPVVVVFPDCGLHDREQEGQLEGTPSVAPDFPAAGGLGLTHLIEHRPIRQAERFGRARVGVEYLDALAHAFEGNVHPFADSIRGRLLSRGLEFGGDPPLLRDPVGVPVGEADEVVRPRRVGEVREIESTIRVVGVDGVDGHHRHLGLRHEVGPDACLATRSHLPACGGTMADGVDASFPVLKLEFPLFVREQARVDARILDELATLDRAFEPRFEQGFPYPVSGPVERQCFRIQLAPIAQRDCEDAAIPM